MKKIAGFFVVFVVVTTGAYLSSIYSPPMALAATTPTTITIQPTPPPSTTPDLIITSIVGSSALDYLEIYNQSDNALSLSDWQAGFTITDSTVGGCANITGTITLPSSWMLPKKYLTMQRSDIIPTASLSTPFRFDVSALALCTAPKLTAVQLTHTADDTPQIVTLPATWSGTTTTVAQHKQRANSPNSSRTISGIFDTDYKIVAGAITLNSDPLYLPPSDVGGLQILEILPNARNCAPTETDTTCNDYIKLYNPTDQPLNLAEYRLRTGYKGQSESVTNTFTWRRVLDPATDELILSPGAYLTLTVRNDGAPLSLTDTGNYVWLEDSYGTATYDPIVQYPDASSTTKIGQAWAYDGSIWRWTSAPQPTGANYFPPEIVPVVTSVATTISTDTSLKPCADDQYRNPATNRCNTIIAAAASLTPCAPDQERNPDTNRCRSIITAASEVTPCQPGWERNPDTNRCRKSAAAVEGAATAAIKDVAAPTSNNTGWLVAGVAIAAALAYAVYEWRQEIVVVTGALRIRIARISPRQFFRRSRK